MAMLPCYTHVIHDQSKRPLRHFRVWLITIYQYKSREHTVKVQSGAEMISKSKERESINHLSLLYSINAKHSLVPTLFSLMIFCCYITVNWIPLFFGFLVGGGKFEDVTLNTGNLWWPFINVFWHFKAIIYIRFATWRTQNNIITL